METLLIGIKNEKARQLLTDLAALDLIEIQEPITQTDGNLSQLRHQAKSRMTSEEIDLQLQKLRAEWQRDI